MRQLRGLTPLPCDLSSGLSAYFSYSACSPVTPDVQSKSQRACLIEPSDYLLFSRQRSLHSYLMGHHLNSVGCS